MIDGYLKWNMVGLCFTPLSGFRCVPGRLMYNEGIVAWTLPQGELWLRLFNLRTLSRGMTGGNPGHLFNLYVLMHLDKHIPHLGDIILY